MSIYDEKPRQKPGAKVSEVSGGSQEPGTQLGFLTRGLDARTGAVIFHLPKGAGQQGAGTRSGARTTRHRDAVPVASYTGTPLVSPICPLLLHA